MTGWSRCLLFFPALVLGLALASAGVGLFLAPWGWLGVPVSLYGVPLVAYRLHQRWVPMRPGVSRLRAPRYNPWWGTQQIQWVYLAFPALEAALRAVPGAFSLWLRAWGAKVGRGVYWTPTLTVGDRGLLEIGEGALFGHGVAITAHVVVPTDGGELLAIVRPVRVGAGAFVGAGVVLGPGAVVAAAEVVPAGSARAGVRLSAGQVGG
ncbi:MAG: hypothetical protein RLZZ383_2782 [Pseudomonadota bacterium]|jgi:hypothetical protein